MSMFFPPHFFDHSDISLRCLGSIAPSMVNATYPMEVLTKFHYAHHIPSLTGRWMDTGATAFGGAVKGSFHRLAHGHHLFEDGFKVLVNPELKFGEFLHHLGMDFLTARGIPNPLLPTSLGEGLIKLGLTKQFVYELMTVNLRKLLAGSVGLVCAGTDVFLAFSDAIPHTFLSAGLHFGLGAFELVCGLYPPSIFLLTAGTAEIGVGIATCYRAIVDPVLPIVGVPGSVFFPALGRSVALASLIGACASLFTGQSWADVPKTVAASAAASVVSTTLTFAASGNGFVGPFIGPLAGVVTYILLRKMLGVSGTTTVPAELYREFSRDDAPNVFRNEVVIPLPGIPKEPIGTIQGDRLLLSATGLARAAAIWAAP